MSQTPGKEKKKKDKKKDKKKTTDTPKEKAPPAPEPSASSSSDGQVATLELSDSLAEECDPFLLASFPEGVVDPNLELALRRQEGKRKAQVTAETEALSMVGKNTGRAKTLLNTSQWLVGVYDPATGTVSAHAVGHVFPMRSAVKGYQARATAPSTATSAKERRGLLFEDFGAAKKKRALAASAANLVSAEQAVGADGLNTWLGSPSAKGKRSSGTGFAGGEEEEGPDGDEDATARALDEARRSMLPRYDPTATDPAKIYDVRGLLGASERASCKRHLADLQSKAGKAGTGRPDASAWPGLVWDRLAEGSPAQVKSPEHAVDLCVLRHLVALFKASRVLKGPLKEDAFKLGMPTDVLGALLEKFAVKQEGGGKGGECPSYRVTKSLTDKLCLHLLAVALATAPGFRVLSADWSKLLALPAASVASLLRQAGARVTSDPTGGKAGHAAVLAAPLVFPQRKRKRG